MRILVVDDQPGMCETIIDILEDAGYVVESAENGIAAVKKSQKSPFDLILMDILMPEKNGVETLKEIKKINPQTIVILMTAYTAPDLIMEAQKAGAYECLMKPFHPERLLNIIKRLEQEKGRNKKGNNQKL